MTMKQIEKFFKINVLGQTEGQRTTLILRLSFASFFHHGSPVGFRCCHSKIENLDNQASTTLDGIGTNAVGRYFFFCVRCQRKYIFGRLDMDYLTSRLCLRTLLGTSTPMATAGSALLFEHTDRNPYHWWVQTNTWPTNRKRTLRWTGWEKINVACDYTTERQPNERVSMGVNCELLNDSGYQTDLFQHQTSFNERWTSIETLNYSPKESELE